MQHLELLRLLSFLERASAHAVNLPQEVLPEEGLLSIMCTQTLVHHRGKLLNLIEEIDCAASELLYVGTDRHEFKECSTGFLAPFFMSVHCEDGQSVASRESKPACCACTLLFGPPSVGFLDSLDHLNSVAVQEDLVPTFQEGSVDLRKNCARGRHLDPPTLESLLPPLLCHNLPELLLLGSEQVPSVQLEDFKLGRLLLYDLALELRVLQSVLVGFDFG